MNMTKGTFAFWCMSIGTTAGFSAPAGFTSSRLAFVGEKVSSGVAVNSRQPCSRTAGCSCPACSGLRNAASHTAGCNCPSCVNKRRRTALFADVTDDTDDDVPAEVAAMDGVESNEEAHNLERPARQQIKKKKPIEGKSLSEFEEGSTVSGTIKSLASYGAFVDIGATTDGLLHVSQLSTEFVSDVSDVVKEGQKVDVRIVKIDSGKGQIGLSMISAEDASAAQEASKKVRGGNRRQGGGRRDDSAVLSSLIEKGWDTSLMVDGVVVSTTDFGAFVKVDASKLNSECEGQFDGLVHISALKAERVSSVSDVVSPNDNVQVRCQSIENNKVSLTMLTVEQDEAKNAGGRGGGGGGGQERVFDLDLGDMGAEDWKDSIEAIEKEEPAFVNTPVLVRK